MGGVHLEVWAAGGYAAALLLVALGLDLLARHVHARSRRFRTAGFRYHAELDHWACPEDEVLWPRGYDAELRLIRYRARPSVCAACRARHLCTDSAHGREVTRELDPWPHSEAGRFHRGMALVPLVLAATLAVIELIRHHRPVELLPLGVLLAGCVTVGWLLTSHLRYTPANFPEPTPSHGLRLVPPRTPADRYRSAWVPSTRSSR